MSELSSRGSTEPRMTAGVAVEFDQATRHYGPGGTVRLTYHVHGIGDAAVKAAERSAVWYTEGKGEEDLGIAFFERVTDPVALPPRTFSGEVAFQLPASPMTYEGLIVKIRWCVRIRLFFAKGRDFVSEHVFDVGDIPPVRVLSTGKRGQS